MQNFASLASVTLVKIVKPIQEKRKRVYHNSKSSAPPTPPLSHPPHTCFDRQLPSPHMTASQRAGKSPPPYMHLFPCSPSIPLPPLSPFVPAPPTPPLPSTLAMTASSPLSLPPNPHDRESEGGKEAQRRTGAKNYSRENYRPENYKRENNAT